MKKYIYLGLCTVFTVLFQQSSFASETNMDYQKILEKAVSKNGPGVAALVSKKGAVIFKGAYGLANIEHQIPLKTDGVFRLGSITKQFTGAAILLLQEQKKLTVTDNINRYIPNFPTQGHKITIEQLLTHTSGLGNFTDDFNIFANEALTSKSIDQVIEKLAQYPMRTKPGEEMYYSNTGYVLLGKIIEVASGQSYAKFVEQHIFKKLDMKSSQYGGSQIIKNRVNGYDATNKGVVNAGYIDMSWPHASGSLLSTLEDMNKWFTALTNNQLISQNSYKQMTSPVILNNGKSSNYGYGLYIEKFNKYQAVSHNGGIHGFATSGYFFPEKDIYIVVLSNFRGQDAGKVALSLAEKLLN